MKTSDSGVSASGGVPKETDSPALLIDDFVDPVVVPDDDVNVDGVPNDVGVDDTGVVGDKSGLIDVNFDFGEVHDFGAGVRDVEDTIVEDVEVQDVPDEVVDVDTDEMQGDADIDEFVDAVEEHSVVVPPVVDPMDSATDIPLADDMMPDTEVAPTPIVVDRFESVQGRTQSLEGDDVRPIVVDEDDEDKPKDVDEKIEDNGAEVDMPDLPLELEIRLKKEAKRKRKFKPFTSNKRHKGHS
ncbi:hypothetical protein EDC96DRAFT_550101 [Choanephora cucurbitarum]|nr:hypothetical protein EDC96DRAFT_550101 [Choanephora cucurbitarum]